MKQDRIKITVVPYDPDWPRRFDEEAHCIALLLGQELVRMHHMGSTAIPGIKAKPIIDLLPEVRDIGRIDDFNAGMIGLGYEPKGEFGIPGRRFFRKNTSGLRTHHLHMFQTGDSEIERHLAFRRYLIAHPEEACAYGSLKEELARKFPEDIEAYTEGKSEFIKETDRKARIWRQTAPQPSAVEKSP